MSYREAAMDIISIAQQVSPNDIGQIELRRAQFTTLSSEAKRMPSSLRKFSFSPGSSSVTPLASSTAISTFCLFALSIANQDVRGDEYDARQKRFASVSPCNSVYKRHSVMRYFRRWGKWRYSCAFRCLQFPWLLQFSP